MDRIIDNQFERVEKALATLINSISTYNPSPALANDLVTADAELSQGLEQLSIHQSNYSKILVLRNTSANLDAQIRETLTLLTTTRSALIATPATTFPTNINPVSYSELLSYGRRITRFTLPPNFRESEPQASIETADGAATGSAATPKDNKSETHTNGSTTPIAVTNGIDKDAVSAMEIDGATPAPTSQALASQTTNVNSSTNISLPNHISAYLDPFADLPFIPWPREESLRRGALASIQILTDQGIDPATFDPEKSAELEAERKRLMEEEDLAREQEREKIDLERRREMERRMSISGSLPGDQRPKQFELETFEDDDED